MRPLLSCVVLSLLLSPVTRAEEAPPVQSLTPAQMHAVMHTYVRGEGMASIPFALAGAATLFAGGLLLNGGTTLGRGAAWPLVSVGALELVAGLVFGLRSGPHEVELTRLLNDHPADFAKTERVHAGRIVHVNQPILLAVEAAMVVAGGIMGGLGAANHKDYLEGVGIGVGVQGLTMFVLDWAVLDRAQAYSTALDMFHPGTP